MNKLVDALFPSGSFGNAVRNGTRAPHVGGAFLAGYRAALHALIPSLAQDLTACLCATEEAGAHPRAIRTTLTQVDGVWILNGRKSWVTGATYADTLFVVASTGTDSQGRNALRLARVDPRAAGVSFTEMPPTPFVPEIPHAHVSFENVPVLEVLDGDGYVRFLKPFRTVEDAHVFAAVLGYLLANAAEGNWPRDFTERTLCALTAFEKVTLCDPAAPHVHILLAGALSMGRQLATDATQHMNDALRERWTRDLPLLGIAGKARAARGESAWKTVTGH